MFFCKTMEFIIFATFFSILKGPGASRRHLGRRSPKRPEKIIWLSPFWKPILGNVGSKIRFLCIFLGSIFQLILNIAFGRPPAPIWVHLGLILGSMLGSFCRLFCRSCKSEKKRPLSSEIAVFGVAGLPFSHLFGSFFQALFHAAFSYAFFPNLGRFWPPNGFPFGLHFRRFCEF